MKISSIFLPKAENDYTPSVLQQVAMVSMGVLVVLSFAATNLQALLWQGSSWLVGAVLPAVVVDLTNSERQNEATPALARNEKLDEAARLKAEDMAKKQYFAHDSPEGITPWYWFDQVAYTYAHAGENLAIHFNDSGAVVEAWMNSPTHRANIVNGVYTEIGVGTAEGEYEGHKTVFVVQLFGTPAAVVQPKKAPVVAEVEAPSQKDVFVVRDPLPEATSQELTSGEEIVVEAESVIDREGLFLKEEKQPVTAQTAPPVASSKEIELATPPQASNESLFTATSSGLLGAVIEESVGGTTSRYAPRWGEFATSPSASLQILYLIVGLFVATILLTSITISIKHARPLQVAYGIALLLLMSALFTLHGTITGTVVIAASNQEFSAN